MDWGSFPTQGIMDWGTFSYQAIVGMMGKSLFSGNVGLGKPPFLARI